MDFPVPFVLRASKDFPIFSLSKDANKDANDAVSTNNSEPVCPPCNP